MGGGLGAVLDLVYPPECAGCRQLTDAAHGLCPACWAETRFITGPVCDGCGIPIPSARPGEKVRCEDCTRHPHPWDRGRAAVLYEGPAREIILRLKHRDRLDLAAVLARWLARAGAPLLQGADIVAPVPLHWTRLLKRRSNQAAELAWRIDPDRRGRVVPDLLTRRQITPSLKGKDRGARRELLDGAIGVTRRHRNLIRGARILLVDDVMTTGATLSAAAAACHAAGAAGVDVLVVARVAREGFAHI